MSSSIHDRVISFPVVVGNKRASGWQAPQSSACSDEEAMARLRTRDCEALHLLFDRYSKLVLSLAVRVLRDPIEAEDILQEVFLYLFQKAALFDSQKGTAKSWIIQLAFHRALDRRSCLMRRNSYCGTDVASLADTLYGDADLQEQVGAKVTLERLQPAFDELSNKQRRTLELFFFEGLQFPEIAETLNETAGNVRHHYYRGLERLRQSFIRDHSNKHYGDR